MKIINYICLTLVIIGALNWGLIGIFSFDLVKTLFGFSNLLLRLIFVLVGISGIYCLTVYNKLDDRAHNDNH